MKIINIIVMLFKMYATHLSKEILTLGKTNSLKKTYLKPLCCVQGNQIGFFFELNLLKHSLDRVNALMGKNKVFDRDFFLSSFYNCLIVC